MKNHIITSIITTLTVLALIFWPIWTILLILYCLTGVIILLRVLKVEKDLEISSAEDQNDIPSFVLGIVLSMAFPILPLLLCEKEVLGRLIPGYKYEKAETT